MLDTKTREAIFKYGVIHELINGTVTNKNKFIKKLCEKEFIFNGKKKIKLSRATIYRLLKKYKESDIDGLKRKTRSDKNSVKSITESILNFAINLRKEVPTRTTQTLIEIIKDKFGIKVAQSTLNYHLARLGYSRTQLKTYNDKTHIRFQSKNANDLWIGDYHDKSGLLKDGREVHISAFIDCKTRYIVHAEYYLKENLFTLEDSFKKAVLKNGCPKTVYLDNAKIYHSKRFAYCCLKLKIHPPIFSKPYVKESRGKIEKWFRYIKENFELEAIQKGGFDNIEELNKHFSAFVELKYQNKLHSETKNIPANEYSKIVNKNYPEINILNELFMINETRKVHKKMKTVSILGKRFVTESFLGGKKVEIHYNPNDLSYVLVYYNNIFIMKAFAQKLNDKPHKKNLPESSDENFKYDYLSALKGKQERLLKESAALTDYSLAQNNLSEEFNFENFKLIFSKIFNRKILSTETQTLKSFYDIYRPEKPEIIIEGLTYAIKNHDNKKFLTFYLDILKIFIYQKRSEEK
jgi:transposase InsO family protein